MRPDAAHPPGTAAFVATLAAGAPLGEAATTSAARDPAFDLAGALALLIRHGRIAAWHIPGDFEP